MDLILVDTLPNVEDAAKTTNKYVVSRYVPGAVNWVNGHYFKTFSEAFAYYASELFMLIPITAIDSHPGLHAAVNKCSGFLDRIAKEKAKKTKAK